jgi:hypothetical protein
MKVIPKSLPKKGHIDASGIKDSERFVFELFKSAQIQSATALHSLKFLNAGNRPFGETDFVVVCPRGIVVFEVKGGSIRSNDDGTFTIGSDEGKNYTTHESPIDQASRNSMAVRSWLAQRVSYLAEDIPVGHAIVMPFQLGVVKGMNVIPQVAALKSDCRDANVFTRWVESCIEYWWKKKGFLIDALSEKEVEETVHLLRGQFDVETSLDIRTGRILNRQDVISDEQVRIIDAADEAARIVVSGGAGSGKSFVIRTLARRAAAEGMHVGILLPRPELQPIFAGLEDLGVKLLGPGLRSEQVDLLFIDEAQDLCNETGFELINSSVSGGLEHGRWRIFLDDNIQSNLRGLWDHAAYQLYLSLSLGFPLRLEDNYRNTDTIVDMITLAVQTRIGRARVSSGEECQQFHDGPNKIVGILNRMREQGVDWDDVCIIVVGDLEPITSLLSRNNIAWGVRFGGRGVLVSTPEEMQGLEYPHVILYVNVPDIDALPARFYVAASRARATLTLVDPNESYAQLVEQNLS